MNLRLPPLHLALTGIAAGSLLAFGALEMAWGEGRLVDDSLHAILENLAGLTSLLMGTFLFQIEREEYGPQRFLLALGFVSMGLLDLFHAFDEPGQKFVLLRSAANLAGGFWFALVWFPQIATGRASTWKRWSLGGIAIAGAFSIRIWSQGAPQTLPAMLEEGDFTPAAIALNTLAGLFFLTAATRFSLDFRRSGNPQLYLFACMATLFGLVGLSFPYSAAWTLNWWFWHVLRLAVSLLVLGFVMQKYRGIVSTLRMALAEGQQTEASLGQAQQRYRRLFEEAPVIYVVTRTREGQPLIEDCNAQFLATLGYNRAEVVGRPLADFYTPASRAEMLEKGGHQRALEGHFVAAERQLVARDGRIVETLLRAMPELDGQGQVWGTRAMFVDITERKQAEEALKVSMALQQVRNEILLMQSEQDWDRLLLLFSEELRGLMKFNHCSINLVDQQKSRTTYYSPAGPTQGGSRRSTLGVYHWEEDYIPEAIGKAMQTGRYVYRPRRTDPLFEKEIESEVASVIDVPFSGGTLAVNSTQEEAFSAGDIAILEQFAQLLSEAHRRLEDLRTLARKEAQLQQAQKMEVLGQLAGGVAHDFNNMLTTIIGYAELVLHQLDSNPQWREMLAEIPAQGFRASRLISQLLTFSRRAEVQMQPLELAAFVKEQVKMLRRTFPESIAVRLNISGQVGRVCADPTQIQQVLMNLCINARDAMPGGGELTVGLEAADLDEAYCRQYSDMRPGNYVCLWVRDTGTGMTPQVQVRIFEPFFTTKEQGKGTGLGLAVVYGIVKGHGGQIHVYTELGKGTEFKIYLPALEEPEKPQQVAEEQRLLGGDEHLLLVEDSQEVLNAGQIMLEMLGYTVLTAKDGKEALELYRAHQQEIELVLTDMTMPEMDGQQLYAALVELDPQVKVVLMSGYSLEERIAELRARGAKDFVQKPFNLRSLAQAVRQALDGQGEAR